MRETAAEERIAALPTHLKADQIIGANPYSRWPEEEIHEFMLTSLLAAQHDYQKPKSQFWIKLFIFILQAGFW